MNAKTGLVLAAIVVATASLATMAIVSNPAFATDNKDHHNNGIGKCVSHGVHHGQHGPGLVKSCKQHRGS